MSIQSVESFAFLWVIFGCSVALVNIFFAIGVYKDAESLRSDSKRRTQLVVAWVWVLATLLGGIFVGVAYWVIHRSTFNFENSQGLPSAGVNDQATARVDDQPIDDVTERTSDIES